MLLLGPGAVHAQDSANWTQQPAFGVCYGESKSAWLVGLGIEGKATAEQTEDFIASPPHPADTKAGIRQGATAMKQGRYEVAEDLGAAQFASCAKKHSLQEVASAKVAGCLYYLRIMNTFHDSKARGTGKEQVLDSVVKGSPRATEQTRRLLAFLATRTYEAKDINTEHRMVFESCAGRR